jgi:hypothetical protein
MRPFITITFFLFLSQLTFGQDRQYLQQIHDSANKLVASFWGQRNFDRYIRLDRERSRYFGRQTDMRASFQKSINFYPNSYRFDYYVVHPAFRGDTARIEFTLDSTGGLQVLSGPEGLYQPGELDSLITIPKTRAIASAKDSGLIKGKGKWKITLEWVETDPMTLDLKPNSTLQQFVQGHYCWAVTSTFKEPYREGCFVYSKRIYYFDVVSGRFVTKKDI